MHSKKKEGSLYSLFFSVVPFFPLSSLDLVFTGSGEESVAGDVSEDIDGHSRLCEKRREGSDAERRCDFPLFLSASPDPSRWRRLMSRGCCFSLDPVCVAMRENL